MTTDNAERIKACRDAILRETYIAHDDETAATIDRLLSRDTRPIHTATRRVAVWIDVDVDIADVVEHLQAVDGIRTFTSCQGTIGERGAEPYGPYVDVSWLNAAALRRLQAEFNIEITGEQRGLVRPRPADAPQEPTCAPERCTQPVIPSGSFRAHRCGRLRDARISFAGGKQFELHPVDGYRFEGGQIGDQIPHAFVPPVVESSVLPSKSERE